MQLKLTGSEIWVANEAVDFRKSIDGLCGIIEHQFKLSTNAGVYIFYNRARDKLKLLAWHNNGFVLIYKRLEKGKFSVKEAETGELIILNEQQMSWLFAGLDWVEMSNWGELEFDDYF